MARSLLLCPHYKDKRTPLALRGGRPQTGGRPDQREECGGSIVTEWSGLLNPWRGTRGLKEALGSRRDKLHP